MIPQTAPADAAGPVADDTIRSAVVRLSRPHPSGGRVIERAVILAAGTESAAILRWIEDHDGQPEALPPLAAAHGLFADRGRPDVRKPLRYVIAPAALAAPQDAPPRA